MRRRKARTSRRQKKRLDVMGYVLITVCVFIFIGFGIFSWKLTSSKVDVDKDTLCPVKGPVALVALVVDQTDILDVIQKEKIRLILAELKRGMKKYEALHLYTVKPVISSLIKPEIVICNPGDPDEVSQLYGNPRLARNKWETAFSNRLEKVFDEMLQSHEATISPIMETIQSISISSLNKIGVKQIPRKLVVISDLLQHVREHSHYEQVPSFKEFENTGYFRHLNTDLKDVEVDIVYIRRETKNKIQGRSHILFWEQYFKRMGGAVLSVKSL